MEQTPTVFERVEQKYLLTASEAASLVRAMEDRMEADRYGRHTILNIYYDTPDFDLIRTSLDRPAYKEKLRLRSYGVPKPQDTVYVELKKKFDGVVYKRRAGMPLVEAEKYLRTGKRPGRDGQILREIDYALNLYGAGPAMFVGYSRIALVGREDPAFRITLDRDVRCRTEALDLTKGSWGAAVLPKDTLLMEVKAAGALPLWFAQLLAQRRIYPASFSKYGRGYALLCQRGGKEKADVA